MNPGFNWLIITDDDTPYEYPDNVKVVRQTFDWLRQSIQQKFDFKIALDYSYKLCDFKPVYGYVFEEEVRGYEYWGHCDCDLIFGNLDRMLTPLLEQGYDKLFAVGHLTIYRNTAENNRRFFKEYQGKSYFRQALSVPDIAWFDEDYREENIHTLFLADQARVYSQDMSVNPAVDYSQFILTAYINEKDKFQVQPFQRRLYVWNQGELEMTALDEHDELKAESFLYMHFQMRYMKYDSSLEKEPVIRIYPNGFDGLKTYPVTIPQWRHLTRYHPNLHYARRKRDNLRKRIKKLRWKNKKA